MNQAYAREMISDHLTALSEHKYGQIALALGTSTETVREVSEYIRRNLNPFPGRGHLGANLSSGGESATTVIPDVIISRKAQADGATSSRSRWSSRSAFSCASIPRTTQVFTESKTSSRR